MRKLLFVLLFLPVLSSVCNAETFKNPQLITLNTSPDWLIQGDIEGNGRPDFIYEDRQGYTEVLHVLRNQGNGQFQPGQDISFPNQYGGVSTLADVNGDGKLDLVLAPCSGFQSEIAVALGNGDGTFQPLIISSLPAYSMQNDVYADISGLAVADLNGDGAADLVFTDPRDEFIGICLGDNAGHFTLTTQFRNGGGPSNVFFGDFNGDGKLDFIVQGFQGASAAVFLNQGGATFVPQAVDTGSYHILSLGVKDMDGDGHPDMVVTDDNNVIRLLHGNADGTFVETASTTVPIVASPMWISIFDIGDYNHDGIPDLAVLSLNGVYILLGQGHFTFKPFQPAPVSLFPEEYPAAIADFNGDGLTDFAFPVGGGIAILPGQADGSLHSADSYDLRYLVTSATLADFNNDGKIDIAAAANAANPLVLAGNGDGTFKILPDTNTSPFETAYNSGKISSGDFNGDGNPDVLVVPQSGPNSTSLGAVVLLGKGDGTFAPGTTVAGYAGAGAGQVAGDLNNDGRSDIELIQDTGDFLLGQADGTFLKKGSVPLQLINTFVYGDFNKDGKLDVANVGDGSLQVENGNGDGTFRAGFQFGAYNPLGFNVFDATTADLDGDGNLDIAAADSSQVEIFYGHGDGTFDSPVFIPLAQPVSFGACCWDFVNAADFNRDGLMDLVLSNGAFLTVIHGAGNRTFGGQSYYLAGDGPTKPLIADLNHDGYPDIVVANNDVNSVSTVTVLLNIPDAGDLTGKLTASPEPSTAGTPFTLNLQLNASVPSSGTPSGTVIFSLDGTSLGTTPLNHGAALFTVSSSVAVGTHTVTALYSGDATFHSSTFAAQHTVVPVVAATQTTLQASPNPAHAGMNVTLTAQVISPAGMPSGVVSFEDGTTTLGTGALSQTGTAIFTTSSLSAGTHTITTVYAGTAEFKSSTSNSVSLVVETDATTTGLTASPNPANAGQQVTLTSKVTSQFGTPGGSVKFLDGTAVLGTGTLSSSGVATFATSALAVGSHSIVASYEGSDSYEASNSQSLVVVVNAETTTTTLQAAPNPAAAGAVVTFKASVASSMVPTGAVTFLDGDSVLGQAALDSNGVAIYTTAALAVGTHAITASYAGTATLLDSVSAAVQEQIVPYLGDFSISGSPDSGSVYPGQATKYHVGIAPKDGFNQDVMLSCSGLPAKTTCAFQPEDVAGGSGSSTLVIQTTAYHQVADPGSARLAPWKGLGGTGLLGSLALLVLPKRLRRRWVLLSAMPGLFILGAISACGGPKPITGGTPPGTYNISITGATSQQTLSHSMVVKLTVKSLF